MEGGKSKLTPEMRQLIEEKRLKALEKRNQHLQRAKELSSCIPSLPVNSTSNIKTSSDVSKVSKPAESNNKHSIVSKVSKPAESNIKHTVANFIRTGFPTKATCVLVSRLRFEVQCSYDKELIEILKTLPTKIYDPEKRYWNFDLRDYKKLMDVTSSLKTVVIEGLSNAVTTAFAYHIKGEIRPLDVPDYDLDNIDKELVSALMPFQRIGVCFGISKYGRVMIADDMGLGKTIQAICLACYYKKEWPLLVVAPSSVKYTWAEEFKRWVPSLRSSKYIHVVSKTKEPIPSKQIIILNYDLLRKFEKDLVARKFQVVIMDESHCLKNSKSMRTLAALPLLKQAKRVILLSGTPALNRPSELYTQIKAINPKLFKSFHDFGLRYCDANQNPWGWDYSGASNMAELQLILEECILIRRLKMDVISELPAKQRRMVILDPSVIKISKELKRAAAQMNANLRTSERHGALLEYFAETGPVKTDAVIQYIFDLLETCKKFILFAHHQKVLDGICEALENKNHDYIRIDGRTSSENRKVLSDKFQSSVHCHAAILSLKAANLGITLTAATRVVFAELYWNPGTLIQAEDRAHRIGQKDCVIVDYLVAKDTADDYIWPLVQNKLDVLNRAGLSKENFSDTNVIDSAVPSPLQPLIEDYFIEDFELDDIPELDFQSNGIVEETPVLEVNDAEGEPISKRFKVSSTE